MKNTTNAKELGKLLAEKTGLAFEAENYDDLKTFVVDIIPALSKKDIFGNSSYDCPTYSFESFFKYFEDECYDISWIIISDKKTMADIFNRFGSVEVGPWSVLTEFRYNNYDDATSENLEDMPEEGEIYAYIHEIWGDTVDFLEQLRAYSAETNTTFSFGCYNLYPCPNEFSDILGYTANEIIWRIENGKITTDGQEIVILDDAEGYRLLLECGWMSLIEVEKLEKYGVSVVLETADDAPKKWTLLDSNYTTGLRIKYGTLDELHQGVKKEDVIASVEKAPIVYSFLSEELQKDRDIAIAFIKSNKKYIDAYEDALEENGRVLLEENLLKASSVIRAENQEWFLNGMPWDFPEVLGSFTDDAEVLALLGSTRMWEVVTFTDENYDEKIISRAIEVGYGLVNPLFDYWYERLSHDKKTDEHVREKYELATDDSLFVVTAFKCIEIIDAGAKNPNRAYATLFTKCNSFCFDGVHDDNRDEVWDGHWTLFSNYHKETARIFRVFPVEKQNNLAYSYFFLVSLMRPADVAPELAEIIAKGCPIARKLLPDEYILRYNLTEEQECDNCRKCGKCYWSNVVFG